MLKKIEDHGLWWLPDSPEQKVRGILTYVPGQEINLEIFGQFGQYRCWKTTPEIILGETNRGKFALYNNGIIRVENSTAENLVTSYYYSNTIFFGKHFTRLEDLKIKSCEVGFKNFDSWLHLDTFVENRSSEDEYVLEYKKPKIEPITVDSKDFTLSIFYMKLYSLHYGVGREIKHRPFVSFEPNSFKDYDWFMDRVEEFQSYLSLISGLPTYPTTVLLHVDSTELYEKHISVYYINRMHREPELRDERPLLYYIDIEDVFKDTIMYWFSNYENQGPVINLLLSTIYNASHVSDAEFLTLIQALEAYHRRNHEGKYLPDAQYKKYCSHLCDAIPQELEKDHQQSLRDRIYYGNELSLRTRINLLFEENEKDFLRFIKHKDNFIRAILNTRNYLTHYDKRLEQKAIKSFDLLQLSRKISLILHFLYITKMGISRQKALTSLRRFGNFSHLFDLKNSPFEW